MKHTSEIGSEETGFREQQGCPEGLSTDCSSLRFGVLSHSEIGFPICIMTSSFVLMGIELTA